MVVIGSAVRVTLVALLVLSQPGCGLNKSPAEGLQFAAPSDWKASPGVLGFMQFWRSPGNNSEFLMLFRSPQKVSANDLFSSDQMKNTMQDTSIQRRESITICGVQPATYVEARGDTNGRADNLALVVTDIGNVSYIAMYARPIAAPPNPAALAALREVCPKP